MRWGALLVVLFVAQAAGQTPSRVTLRGRAHDVAVPAGWTLKAAGDSLTFAPPKGRTAGVNLYAVARTGQNDPFGVADHYVKDFTAKLPHLQASETRPIRLVGQNGALKVLTGTAKVPEELWVAVALGPQTIYVFTAYGSVTEIAILEKDLKKILEGIVPLAAPAPAASPAPAPAAPPVEKQATVEDAYVQLDKIPPLPQPSSARPLVDDPLIGLTIDAVPDWGVAISGDATMLDKRLGQGKRILVAFMLADQAFGGDGAAFARAVAKDGRYVWDRYAGRTALSREAPDGRARELYLLRRGLPLHVLLVIRGTSWNDPAAEAARKQLEKVMHVADPTRPDAVARARVVVGGVAAVDVPKGWAFTSYGPGASARFAGPAGARARLIVITKLQVAAPKPGAPLTPWPEMTCDADGARAELKPARLAGRDARVGECPRDADAQVGWLIDAGTHWIGVELASPEGGHAAALAAFPKAVKLL